MACSIRQCVGCLCVHTWPHDIGMRRLPEYAQAIHLHRSKACVELTAVMQGAWKGRQNAAAALDVVDNFYSTLLSATLQHDIQEKDLDLPLHSDRAHRLLEPNTAAINMSYTVF